MIYKYKPYVETGPFGAMVFHKDDEKNVVLGSIDGYTYVYTSAEQLAQDERLQAVIVELDERELESLKKQRFAAIRKEYIRLLIEKDVGDIYDLLADAMKLIEFNMLLTARLAGDLWGTNPLDTDKKAVYAQRNKYFLEAVDAGDVTLRGDFEDMNTVMEKMLERVSTINCLVRDKYIAELQEVGLS